MVKAIFFDVDGTLVSFRTHAISPAVLDALGRLREQGVLLFLSTGRHPLMLDGVRAAFPFDGYITLSGQYCFCGDQVLRSQPMEPRAVEQLVAAALTGAFSCIFLERQELYLNLANQFTARFMEQLHLPMPPVADPRRALGREVYQAIAFLTRDNQSLLLDRAPELETTRWHPDFLDVIPRGGGKDLGMDALLDHFGLRPEQAMAFGDGENDLSMLVHAGVGVAMGSASGAVKRRADYVTGTVDEDGVVSALRQFGLLAD